MIILASASPRRREICELLGLDFTVIPAKNEIEIDTSLSPEDALILVARSKAAEVFERHPSATVIGSDTSVLLDGRFLGKPASEAEAFEMLRSLSGKTHRVLTGVYIISPDKECGFCESASVEFASLTDEEIFEYIGSGEPMDKAGAYAIQGKGARFIKGIKGDFYTVMGLPCQRLYEEIKKF